MLVLLSGVYVVLVTAAAGFNVDTRHADVVHGPPESHFGYSVALRWYSPGTVSLVVGAPLANSSFAQDDVFVETGEAFECKRIGADWSCAGMYLRPSHYTSNVANFRYNLRKDHAGFGAAIDTRVTTDAALVVCAPGMKNVLSSNLYMNGICFLSKKGSKQPFVQLPLVINDRQLSTEKFPYYAYGEAGFSVHLTQNGTELLIGAPGVRVWTGTVIKYATNKPDAEGLVPDTLSLRGLDYYDYFGFSVNSGKFFSSTTLYVSGAPRAAILRGKVLVFSYQKNTQQLLQIHQQLVGHQMGEYFGWVLCVVDLNADGLDDLVVGAPHHTLQGSAVGDEGRIYVYLGHTRGAMLELKNLTIAGDSYPAANFGTSIASVGDINMDGYQDIAVGAPYEGSGAIYIYHGSRDGLRAQYAQRITAADVAPQVPLSGFGFSISSGLDFDGNHYNDLAVGAYDSAHAVLLWSRPVVHLHGSLAADVTMISLTNLSFSFTTCISFTGHFLPPQLGVTATVKVDSEFNRAIVDGQGSIVSYNTSVNSLAQICENHTVKIKAGVDNFVNPVNVSLDLSMQDPLVAAGSTPDNEFCKSCPVTDPDARSAKISVLFDNGCGEDAVCQTDLAVHAELLNISKPYVLDPERPLKLAVEITNSKEPAYQSRFTLETSGEVTIVRLPSSCLQLFDTSSLRIECVLGHKSLTNTSKPVETILELGVGHVSADTEELVFNVTAYSSGEEQAPANNMQLLHLGIFTDTQPILIGRSKPATLYFNQQSDEAITLLHIYEVRSSGPSPIGSINLEFLVPTAAALAGSTTHVVDIDGVTAQLGSHQINCSWSPATVSATTAEVINNTTLELSCEERPAGCILVMCRSVGPFLTTRSIAVVSLYMRALPAPLYAALGKQKVIEVSSLGRAVYTLPRNSVNQNRSSSVQVAVVSATTMLIAEVAMENVEPWILLLAIIAGLLILLLIILGMYKAGFFRRKRADYGLLHEGTVMNNDDEKFDASPGESTRLSHKN